MDAHAHPPAAPPQSEPDQTSALFNKDYKGIMFFEKWDQLSSQVLYISVGVFAVLPTAIAALRKPYRMGWLVGLLIGVGLIAIWTAAILKLHLSGYFRRLALLNAGVSLTDEEKRIEPNSWRLFKWAGRAAFLEIITFIVFIGFNIPTTFQEPPRVTDVRASQTVVEPGTSVTLQVTASDRDDDLLTYTWAPPRDGTLVDKDQPAATWVAPKMIKSAEEEFPLSVDVYDGHEHVTKSVVVFVREPPEIQAGIQRLCLMQDTIDNAEGEPDSASGKKIGYTQQSLPHSPFVKVNFQSEAAAQTTTGVGLNCPRYENFVRTGVASVAEEKARIDVAETSLRDRFTSALKKLLGGGKKGKELPCCGKSLNPFTRCKPC
jgi:hypothetical protein